MTTALPVRLFASDLDGTLLGDDAALRRFQLAWDALEGARRPLLVYNTSRSVADVRWLVLQGRVPSPEFIIGGLGTEIQDLVDGAVGDAFHAELSSGWNLDAIDAIVRTKPEVRPQPAEHQGRFKSSWHWTLASRAQVAGLAVQLEEAGLDVTISYSADVHLDIVPRRAGKGNALAWLCRRIGIDLHHTVVAGAGGTNASMFELPGVRGIVTGNSSRELLAATSAYRPFLSGATYADGVLAGLVHHGVLGGSVAETEPVGNAAASAA